MPCGRRGRDSLPWNRTTFVEFMADIAGVTPVTAHATPTVTTVLPFLRDDDS